MTDFDEVTTNIRKSFRLLFNFIKTFHGIIKFIGKRFDLNYIGDKQIWGVPPQNNKKNIENKGIWDWLPIYYYVYNFNKDTPQFQFSVILQCDTGYFDYYDNQQKWKNWDDDEIYDKIDKYDVVENAKTRIIFGLCDSKNIDISAKFEEKAGEDFVNHLNLRTKDGKNEFEFPVSRKSNKYIYFKVFELADFKDEATARQSLEKFVEYLGKKGIKNFNLNPNN